MSAVTRPQSSSGIGSTHQAGNGNKPPKRILVGAPQLTGGLSPNNRLPPLHPSLVANPSTAVTVAAAASDALVVPGNAPTSGRGAPRFPQARVAPSRPNSARPASAAAARPTSAAVEKTEKCTAKCCKVAHTFFCSTPLQCVGAGLACCNICVYTVPAVAICCLGGCCEEPRECAVGMCRVGWLNCKIAPTAICSLCCIKILCSIPSCLADCCCPNEKESCEIDFYERVSFVCYNKAKSDCCSSCCCTSVENLEDRVNTCAIDCCFASRPNGTALGQDLYQTILDSPYMLMVFACADNRSFYQNILPAELAKRKEKLKKPATLEMQRSPSNKSGGTPAQTAGVAEVYAINEDDGKSDS